MIVLKVFNKKFIAIIAIVVAIVFLIVLIVMSGNSTMKISYELQLDEVPIGYDYDLVDTGVGIQCGSVKIYLGQSIDISAYTIEEELHDDGVYARKLLAPSKKYELVVVGSGNTWYVHEIRTTVPDVYNLQGYTVGDELKKVRKLTDIPKRKKVRYQQQDKTETRLEFVSGYLIVIDMRCV